LGAITGACGWLYAACFKITGFRQASQWRKRYLKAILRQDIEWFDVNNANELPSNIAETTQKIEVRISLVDRI
jgi:ATP-binding cassette subfamily B (MDR/TAP) protein 1